MEDALNPNFDAEFGEPNYSAIAPTEQVSRRVPFSDEAERSVVGAMPLNKDCIPDVIGIVKETDFYTERHAELYRAICQLYDLGKPIDLVTLKEQLTLMGQSLKNSGGIEYVVDVANSVPSIESVKYYAEIVKDKAVQRSLIRLASTIEDSCYAGNRETDEIIKTAQQDIIDITQGRTTKGLVPLGIYINESVELLDKLSQKSDTITGIPTGFIDVDKKTSGLHNAELILDCRAARYG